MPSAVAPVLPPGTVQTAMTGINGTTDPILLVVFGAVCAFAITFCVLTMGAAAPRSFLGRLVLLSVFAVSFASLFQLLVLGETWILTSAHPVLLYPLAAFAYAIYYYAVALNWFLLKLFDPVWFIIRAVAISIFFDDVITLAPPIPNPRHDIWQPIFEEAYRSGESDKLGAGYNIKTFRDALDANKLYWEAANRQAKATLAHLRSRDACTVLWGYFEFTQLPLPLLHQLRLQLVHPTDLAQLEAFVDAQKAHAALVERERREARIRDVMDRVASGELDRVSRLSGPSQDTSTLPNAQDSSEGASTTPATEASASTSVSASASTSTSASSSASASASGARRRPQLRLYTETTRRRISPAEARILAMKRYIAWNKHRFALATPYWRWWWVFRQDFNAAVGACMGELASGQRERERWNVLLSAWQTTVFDLGARYRIPKSMVNAAARVSYLAILLPFTLLIVSATSLRLSILHARVRAINVERKRAGVAVPGEAGMAAAEGPEGAEGAEGPTGAAVEATGAAGTAGPGAGGGTDTASAAQSATATSAVQTTTAVQTATTAVQTANIAAQAALQEAQTAAQTAQAAAQTAQEAAATAQAAVRAVEAAETAPATADALVAAQAATTAATTAAAVAQAAAAAAEAAADAAEAASDAAQAEAEAAQAETEAAEAWAEAAGETWAE